MSATIAAPRAHHAVVATAEATTEASTREQILRLVVADGPITAAELAERLELTSAGIRRHVGALEAADQIAVHRVPGGHRGRGRPARHYVATQSGHRALANAYAALAVDALQYLEKVAGPEAVGGFAEAHGERLEARYAAAVVAAGSDPSARIEALAGAMTADGYAATARPVPGGHAIQLCQGHCPVQQTAAQFPQFCEAETRAFSRLLGVHVQRLSTLAAGGHVCTTNVPTASAVVTTPTEPTVRPIGAGPWKD